MKHRTVLGLLRLFHASSRPNGVLPSLRFSRLTRTDPDEDGSVPTGYPLQDLLEAFKGTMAAQIASPHDIIPFVCRGGRGRGSCGPIGRREEGGGETDRAFRLQMSS